MDDVVWVRDRPFSRLGAYRRSNRKSGLDDGMRVIQWLDFRLTIAWTGEIWTH